MGTLFEENQMSAQMEQTQNINEGGETVKAKRIRRTKAEMEDFRREEAAKLLNIDVSGAEASAAAAAQEKADRVSLLKKLHTVQKCCLGILKDAQGTSSDGKSFGFASGNAVLGQIRPLMDELGLMLNPRVVSTESDPVDIQTVADDGRVIWTKQILYRLKIVFEWVDVETGATLECPFVGAGCNGLDQGIGSALTYAERYFLLKYFHIPTDGDDLDSMNRTMSSITVRSILHGSAQQQAAEAPLATVVDSEKATAAEAVPEPAKEEKPKRSRKKAAKEESPVEAAAEGGTETEEKPAGEPAVASVLDAAAAQQEKQEEVPAESVKEVLPETKATPAAEPKSEKKTEPVLDSKGRALEAEEVKGADFRPELKPGSPFWFKASMNLFGSGLSKEALRSELEKGYVVSDADFEAFWSEISA